MLKVRRAQDQVSRSLGRPASLEETVGAMATFYLQHKDPLEKARRVIAKKGTLPINKLFTRGTVHAPATSPTHERQPIPAAIAHQIRVRDQNQCQAKRPGGGICGEKRWTDLHHVLPVSKGGSNEPQNLVTLCKAHHQEHHRRN